MRVIFALALMLAAADAAGADYAAQPGSTLVFSASFQGESFNGKFERFTPQIRFEPTRLQDSRFDVAIDLGSADTDNTDRDEVLLGPEFFAIASQSQARYVATTFRHLGDNRYAADGTLTLRGISRPVELRFTWTPGATPVLTGQATVKRLAFKVGTGDWSDTSLMPDEVTVNTRLQLAPSSG
jgi:polyisoprenoid-binding protein YceI